MTLFIDTANIDEIARFMKWGCFKGITTNQKIFSMEKGINFEERITELAKFKVPVSIEITKTWGSADVLVEEGTSYTRRFGQDIVVKVPMWKDGKGLEVANQLIKNAVKVNMTCLMSLNQVILASEIGVTYASLFYNRIIDYLKKLAVQDPKNATHNIIKASRQYIDNAHSETQIICGSIREPEDVENCFISGSHIVTVTPKIIEQMPFHQKTEETINEFDEAWKQFQNNKKDGTPIETCPLCQIPNTEKLIYENGLLYLVQTKELKGHKIRVMACIKRHDTNPSFIERTTAYFLLHNYMKRKLPNEKWAFVADTYATIPSHWHLIATSQETTDLHEAELMQKTPNVLFPLNFKHEWK